MTLFECFGTRKPLLGVVRLEKGTSWQRKYGVGECSICGKHVTSHKDGTAVQHEPA